METSPQEKQELIKPETNKRESKSSIEIETNRYEIDLIMRALNSYKIRLESAC